MMSGLENELQYEVFLRFLWSADVLKTLSEYIKDVKLILSGNLLRE